MKYAIKIRSIIWRKISIYSVQGLPVGSNNVGFDVIGASPEECYGYAGPVGKSGSVTLLAATESLQSLHMSVLIP